MANRNRQVPENVPGDFFVDDSCIDCDACRQIAPRVFGETAETSFVRTQPVDDLERRSTLHALLTCPTGSIGCTAADDPKVAMGDFPLAIEGDVSYCGFNSPKSFGGNSYFVRHPDGNWLVDSPKFVAPLVHRLEQLGGIRYIFLTHQDDVADAHKYARHFSAQRIIHEAERAAQPDAEIVIRGNDSQWVVPDFLVIPTPGHTAGHCCLLFQRFLFTGDHLAWDRHDEELIAYRDYCWHSWPKQIASIERLADHSFEWILPGHGQRVRVPREQMRIKLLELVARMKGTR